MLLLLVSHIQSASSISFFEAERLLIGVGAAMFLSGRGRLDSIPRSFGDLFSRSNGHGTGRRSDANPTYEPRHSSSGSVVGNAGEAISDAARSAASGVKDAASSVRSTAVNVAEQVGAGASNAVSAVKDTAISVGERVGDLATTAVNAAGEEATHLRDQALHVTHDLRDRAVKLAEEQPLIVAVAGIALGAIIAAALPRTKVEDDLMGETSDTIKNAAGEVATEQIAKISSEAEKVADEIKETVAEHGLTSKAAADVVREAGDRMVTALGSGEKGPASSANIGR